jgi:glycosyltransferase involved in cell wall biosynthesis
MPELPRVSVVAPSYQRRAGLPRFVEPLLAEPELHELVIAVDGSTDGSVEWLRERGERDPRLKVLDLPNRGVGPTRQAGVEAATGDVVLLMDDDVIAGPGLVAGHARHHAQGGRRLVLGYMPHDPERMPPGRRGIGHLTLQGYERSVERYERDPQFVLTGLWGGNLSMPREEFLRVRIEGMAIKRGQDDKEFGIRCHKAGIQGEFDRSLRATHEFERSLEAYRRDCRIMGESRRMLSAAHGDLLGGDVRAPEPAHPEHGVGTGLPRPLRAIWPALARDPLFRPVTAVLGGLFALGVRAGSLRLEMLAARALGSLETTRGALGE